MMMMKKMKKMMDDDDDDDDDDDETINRQIDKQIYIYIYAVLMCSGLINVKQKESHTC